MRQRKHVYCAHRVPAKRCRVLHVAGSASLQASMDFSTPFHSVCIVGCGLSGCGVASDKLVQQIPVCATHHVQPPQPCPQMSGHLECRLYAARLLRKQFPDLICLEANDRIGGRVQHVRPAVAYCKAAVWRLLSSCHDCISITPDEYPPLTLQLEDFVAWPVQEGPEFVRALCYCALKPRTALHHLNSNMMLMRLHCCTLVLCDADPGAWFECTAQGALHVLLQN